MLKNYKIIAVGCGMLYAMGVQAQQDTTAYLKDRQLQELEVVGEHQHQALRSATPLQRLTHKDFRIQGVKDMADALRRLPGITLRDYGGAGGMKTVSVRGFGAQHTAVIYDGIALSDCQSGQIDLSRYSLDNMESLSLQVSDNEEIFVPARQVASASALTIQSMREPNQDNLLHLKAQLTVGSFGHVSPFVKLHQTVSQKLTLSANGIFTHADNDYPFTLVNVQQVTRERRTNSRMNSGQGEVNLLWRPTPHSQWTGKAYYYDNDRQLPGIVHYYAKENDETLHERNAFAQLNVRNTHEHWRWMLNGKWNWASTAYRNGKPSGGITSSDYWQREGYAALAIFYAPHVHWAFDYSADYIMNNLNSSLKQDNRPTRHSAMQSATVRYSNPMVTVTARLWAGLFFDQNPGGEGAGNKQRLSPSVSVSWRPWKGKDLFVRASWKQIYRMPTFNELYYYHLGNTLLKPENTNQWNMGLTYQSKLTSKMQLTLTADAYTNSITDKIVAIPFNMFVWRMLNVDKVRGTGADITLALQYALHPRHTLGMNSNYTWQRIRYQSDNKYNGNQIAYMPEHSFSATLWWQNPWIHLATTLTGNSERWTTLEHNEGTCLPGYMEWSASASHEFKWGSHQLRLQLNLQNILDKQYEVVANYPMPGRSWKLTASYSF